MQHLRASGPLPISPHASGSTLDYEHAFATADRTLDFFLADGRPIVDPPGALLAELGLFGEEGCGGRASAPRASRLAIPFLTRWLIEKSHSLRYSDSVEMLHWALMARIAAAGCSVEAAGSEAKRADLKARAEAQLSNTLRVLGRIEEAEGCMKTAWAELERGTGDPELRASVFVKTTSLLTSQKNFQLGIDLSVLASKTFANLGMRHHAASAKVIGAIAALYEGDAKRAAHTLRRALPEIDPDEDPTLLLATRINLVRCYIDLGEPARALDTQQGLLRVRRNIEPLLLLRMDWQQGLLLNALDDRPAATRTLDRVRRGFVERRLAREAIVVTRDLVRMFAESGEDERASRVLDETAEWILRMSFGAETSRFFAELQPTIW